MLRDGELACDEQVCQILPHEERMAYGQTLLTVASHGVRGEQNIFCTAMSPGAKTLKSRLEVIKKCHKMAKGERIIAVALVLALGLAGLLMGYLHLGSNTDLALLAYSDQERFTDELAASLCLRWPTPAESGGHAIDNPPDQLMLNFTIPPTIPSGYQVAILVQNRESGIEEKVDQFAIENTNGWQPGQIYQTAINATDLAGYDFQLSLVPIDRAKEQAAYWTTFRADGFGYLGFWPLYKDWRMAYLDVLRDFIPKAKQTKVTALP